MPAVLWAAVLLYIGGQSNVPTVETTLPVDKAAHFVMYGVLGYLATSGWLKTHQPRRLLWVLLLAMAVGAADETHQRVVPNRSSDIMDWIADVTGITVVALVWLNKRKGQGHTTNVV